MKKERKGKCGKGNGKVERLEGEGRKGWKGKGKVGKESGRLQEEGWIGNGKVG